MIRRLDHVAIAVTDTASALDYFAGRLGLSVVAEDVIARPHVRLTYLDAGNAYIQLVEPLDDDSPIAAQLASRGEGLHHICFGVDDVETAAAALSTDHAASVDLGSGRGRVSAFVPGPRHHGVPVECTEFNLEEDVHGIRGWLDD